MSVLIIALALYGFIASDHLVRKVMCIALIESTIILAFLDAGYAARGRAPILDPAAEIAMVDPLPQALMLTAIVIGVCFNALALALIVRVGRQRGTMSGSQLHD
ncbi:MAG: cation:proton antiporter subunit C [Kiritimatiellae bacterium]|nr:cation:proton antiporter subunit C [Kiritimatiellia bacterium]